MSGAEGNWTVECTVNKGRVQERPFDDRNEEISIVAGTLAVIRFVNALGVRFLAATPA